MEVSPFPVYGPVEPDRLVGRGHLVGDLIARITARRVTALIGPRRFGKTSVLRKVASELETAGAVHTVWLDLYEVSGWADLAIRLDSALAAPTGDLASSLRQIAAGARLNLGVVQIELTRKASERPDPQALVHSLLDTFVSASQRLPVVLVIDEFQGIVAVEGAAGLLRTKLQHHYAEIGLMFAGSQPSLMRSLFSDPKMPFYSQADLVEIEPFDLSATRDLIVSGFEATDRDPGHLAESIFGYTEGHPYRTVQCADAAWRHSQKGQRYEPGWWTLGLNDLRGTSSLSAEAMFSSFDTPEKAVLRLLASGRGLFGADAHSFGLGSASAYGARDRLLAEGAILKMDSKFKLTDPVFGDWIRQRFGS